MVKGKKKKRKHSLTLLAALSALRREGGEFLFFG
jgi:hypothetical protein